MGLMDWLQSLDLDPMKLIGDSPILQEPTPQQPQVLSPTEWLAQKQSQEQAQQQMSADMVTPEVTTPATAQDEKRVLTPQEWLAQQPNRPIENPINLENATNLAYKVGSALKEPASMALEALSYLDKPRAAIAGAVQAMQDDTPVLEGAKQGWEQNTSWKETFPDDYVKDHPTRAAVTGLGWDIAFDPLWLVPPAKVGSLVGKASKAIGLTDKVIAPAVSAFKGTEGGQKAINFVEDTLGLNNPLQQANEVYNATKASLSGEVKPVLNYVEDVFGKELKGVNRADAEAYMQRMVESYPNIGKFARAGYEVAARDATMHALQSEISKAKIGANEAKTAVEKLGKLTDEEKVISDILKNNVVETKSIDDAVRTAQGMGEVIKPLPKMASDVSNNIRIKKAAFDLILAGKFPESDIPKLLGMFSKEELTSILPNLERKFKGSSAIEEIKRMATTQGELKANPASALENRAINEIGKVDNGISDIGLGMNAGLKPINLSSKQPNLMNDIVTSLDGKGVLPNVKISNKVKDAVNLANITEDGRQLLANIKNVPELAAKIGSEKELSRQLNALESAKQALQKADISPEKTTQVIDSALKNGYTPAQVEGMFKVSERMREVNQLMTNEAAKRVMITVEDAAAFSGGRHLRRMYAALENPEQHYNNLLSMGNKELADKFWASYSKMEGGLKAKGTSLNMATFEARKNLPKEVQEQLGKLYEATYPFAKGNKIAAEQYAKHDFLKQVSEQYGSDTMKKGFKKVPITEGAKFGQLEGKFLPERVYQEVLFSVSKHDSEVTTWQKGVQRWKATKLINPASVMHNMMTGTVMANVFGDISLHKMPKVIAETWLDMKNVTARWMQARNDGLFEANITKGEIDAIANKTRGVGTGIVGKYDNVLAKGMKIYSIPDNFWRMAVYNHGLDSGKTSIEAVRTANRALFDYSNAPRWIESLSRTGIVPFAKFPFFAAKETTRALWNKPAEVTKFLKPQNQDSTEDKEKIMPDYMKARTLLPLGDGTRIVDGKEQKVQNNLDLSYILPFASDVKLGNPLVDALVMDRTGKNGLGQQVIKPGMRPMEELKEWGKWGLNAIGPSFPIPIPDSIPLPSNYAGEKLINGYNGKVDSKGRQYDLTSAVLQTLLGLKNVPVNNEELYNQKLTGLENDKRNSKAMSNLIKNDQMLSEKQRSERLYEQEKQYKELERQIKGVKEAWQRIKKKG